MLDWGDWGGVIHAPISCWLPGWASRVVRTRKAVVDNIDAVLSYIVEGTAWERHIGNMEHSSTKNIERTPQLVPIRDKLILPSVPSTEPKNTKKRQAIVLQLAFQWSNTHEMNTINTPRYRMILLHISSTGCWSWSSPRRRMIDGKSGGRPQDCTLSWEIEQRNLVWSNQSYREPLQHFPTNIHRTAVLDLRITLLPSRSLIVTTHWNQVTHEGAITEKPSLNMGTLFR